MAEKHIVKLWRGTRESYNALLTGSTVDYWTRYSVKEPGGGWTEYFGISPLTDTSGQLLPVIDIVDNLPSGLTNGDRYLLGNDANGYNIVEVRVIGGTSDSIVMPFTSSYTVRVKNRNYMTYQYVGGDGVTGGKLITYDQIDCGTY